jgi:hypothetical protein
MCVIYQAIADSKLGEAVRLTFQITQITKDQQLLLSFKDYFGCGNFRERIGRLVGDFYNTKLSDLNEKIIPFFIKYPVKGVKFKDFEDFCKVAKLMQNKAHLTAEGLDQIRKIRAGMNKGRPDGDGL